MLRPLLIGEAIVMIGAIGTLGSAAPLMTGRGIINIVASRSVPSATSSAPSQTGHKGFAIIYQSACVPDEEDPRHTEYGCDRDSGDEDLGREHEWSHIRTM